MAVLRIPAPEGIADFEEAVELDGLTYNLRFRWNHRAAAWFVDIADAEGNPLAYGRRVTADGQFTRTIRHLVDLPGELSAFDTTHRQTDPGLKDLDQRVLILYFEAAEIA